HGTLRRGPGDDGHELPAVLAERVQDLARVVLEQRRHEVLPLVQHAVSLSVARQQLLADVADAHAHDHVEPAGGRDRGRLFADDVFLQPQHLRADRDGVPRDRGRLFGATEHVHHVDRQVGRKVAQRRIRLLAEHLGFVRRHGHDAVSVCLKVARNLERRPARPRGQPDHRDRVHVTEQYPERWCVGVQSTAHAASFRTRPRSAWTMNPVAPHTVVSPSTYHQPRHAMPFSSRSTRSSSIAASRRSGTCTTRAISASLTTSAGSSGTTATNGVTRIPLTYVWTGGSAPSTASDATSTPISSRVSRRAVAMRSASSASCRPPGNDISPAWRDSIAARSVNTSSGSSAPASRAHTATSRTPGA